MKVKSESEVAQLCPTLSDPIDYSLPGSSAHGILQARVLEWVPVPSPPMGDSTGGSVVKNLPSNAGTPVRFLVRELISTD